MSPCAAERRLFLGSLLLSLSLHLGLAGLGVMTSWGRTLTPPPVLEVRLVAPSLPAAGQASGSPDHRGAAGVTSGPPALKAKRASARVPRALAPPRPAVAEKRQTPPADAQAPAVSLAPTSQPPRPLSPGDGAGGAGAAVVSGPGFGPGVSGAGEGGQGPGLAGSAQSQYLSLIRARILARRHYPHLARQRHQEGVVRVRFSLSPAGALNQGVEVVQPSGFGLLDEQARQCVRAAAPFPPFPAELNQDHLTIEVPIVYRLTEGE